MSGITVERRRDVLKQLYAPDVLHTVLCWYALSESMDLCGAFCQGKASS